MYDVIIIGAGVSGIACALTINKNLKTLLIDSNEEIGKKLAITGNGRCNITNSNYGENFLENIYNYKFMYSAFSQFDNFDLMELMLKYNVELKEEDRGRMFPTTNKSKTIIEAFQNNLNHVDLHLSEKVLDVKKQENFQVTTSNNTYTSKKVVIATGGLSYPQTGSDGFGLKIAKEFGHRITKLIASEAPLYSDNIICQSLQGVTLESCAIKYNKKSYSGFNLLFTHFGLSGPLAFRQCFNIIDQGIKEIKLDFISTIKYEDLKDILKRNSNIKKTLNEFIPKSLIEYLIDFCNIDNNEFSKLSHMRQDLLLNNIKNYSITISKYADVSKGFTTAGGIETSEIDNKTFESKIIKDMYFIGEVLNVHAHTGGYNISTYFSMGVNCAKCL